MHLSRQPCPWMTHVRRRSHRRRRPSARSAVLPVPMGIWGSRCAGALRRAKARRRSSPSSPSPTCTATRGRATRRGDRRCLAGRQTHVAGQLARQMQQTPRVRVRRFLGGRSFRVFQRAVALFWPCSRCSPSSTVCVWLCMGMDAGAVCRTCLHVRCASMRVVAGACCMWCLVT